MKLCLVSQEYPPHTAKGGIGTQTQLKAHGMAQRGHDVTVLSASPDDQPHAYADGAVHVVRIPPLPLATFTDAAAWLARSVAVAQQLATLHQCHPFDLVDFPEWGCEAYVHLVNQSPWNRLPTVIHLHGPLIMFANTMGWPEYHSPFYNVGTHMEQTCLKLADAIFSSSETSAHWAAKYYDIDRAVIPVIHTGVDTHKFTPRPADIPADPTVVFVGSIVRNKGVATLTEAVCRLRAQMPRLKLRLVGRGEPQVVDELVAIAQRYGATQAVEMVGYAHRERLPEELAKAHLFAAPSEYEGGPGFVYLEAMACGLPVIACAGSGAAEVVHEGVNGELVPPGDLDALVAALRSMLGDLDAAQQMGRRGREYVLKHHDSRLCLDRMEAFYISAAQNAAARAEGR